MRSMASVPAVMPPARQLLWPGRREVLVAASLADLTGPEHGPVELPIWLFWFPDRRFDLDEPGMLAWMYQIVLREARRPARPRLPERRPAGHPVAGPAPAPGGARGLGRAAPGAADGAGPGRHLMPIDELQRAVATVALRAAARHGFALAGGNALIAHGIVDRPTDDVNLFSNQEAGVAAATEVVETALRAAGFQADRQDGAGGLADVFYGLGDGMAEWIVTAPGGQQTMLQLAYFDRSHRPVTMDVGPVLALEDLAGFEGLRAGQPGRAARLHRHRGRDAALPGGPADRLRPAAGSRPGRPRLRRRGPRSWTGCRMGCSPVTGSARPT